jgi:tetratricopeptide (TPR) repeat protein
LLRSAQGRQDEALALLQQAQPELSRDVRPADRARFLAALAEVQLASGQPAAALVTLQDASAAFDRLQPRLSAEHANLLVETAKALLALARPADAIAPALRAAQRWDEIDKGHRSAGLAWWTLGQAQRANGQASREAFTRATAAFVASGTPREIAEQGTSNRSTR